MVDLFALLLCLLIAFILTRGVRTPPGSRACWFGSKVGLVVLIIAVGVFYINTENYTPFLPFGWGGVLPAPRWCSSPCSVTTR